MANGRGCSGRPRGAFEPGPVVTAGIRRLEKDNKQLKENNDE
jgi:hypothetical protein